MANKKKRETSSPTQSRTFALELYPEWSYLNDILTYISKYKYALILHDKDVNNETGEVKKAHYHVVLEYEGKRLVSAVQNDLKQKGLETRFVQPCNERAMLRYLVHKDDPEKYQYQPEEVKTNMFQTFANALVDKVDEEIGLMQLCDWIEKQNGKVSSYSLNKYAYENGALKSLRKFSQAIQTTRIEHNKNFEITETIDAQLEKERLRMKVASEDMLDKSARLVETFGATTIEINGKEYTLTQAPKKKNTDTDNTEYEQIDMLKEARKHHED